MVDNSATQARPTRSKSTWESIFGTWSSPPSATETKRAENAESMIRSAIAASEKLRNRDIKVFTQGSYRNRVNTKLDSDVDIGIVCFDSYFSDYPDDNVKSIVKMASQPATYTYALFKNEIEEALVAKFGRAAVTRGSKAFDVSATSYRVEADVAAFFEHRRYTNSSRYISGVEMIPDDYSPPRIRNWPEQHYSNGVAKNTLTSKRYKRMVRIIKSLSNEMASCGVASAKAAPSFLVECLVFNIPDGNFLNESYWEQTRAALAWLYINTVDDTECSEWGEVSELKYLFRGSQPWTRQSAHQFISDAWDYVGFE